MSEVLLKDIVAGRELSVIESRNLMLAIGTGGYSNEYLAALLTALSIRGLSVDLLDGFSSAALELATPVNLGDDGLIDLCGTGGDGKGSFNISTTVAFVLAGAGYRIAKHGNVGVSSSCGSSNVLEALGINLSSDEERLKRSLEASGVCFLHAPLFHPAFKSLAPIRKELGFRTIFNALGPLINPAQISFQYSGVYSRELQRLYSYLLTRRGRNFAVIHSIDGFDEISLTTTARVATKAGLMELSPSNLQSRRLEPFEIAGAESPRESAKLIEEILGNRSPDGPKACVVANAAVAAWCYHENNGDIREYLELARESIDSGRALAVLRRCQEM
jgi:anthranilate phosphoribosyltransferase